MDYEAPLFFRVMRYAASADRDVIDMVSGNPDWGAPPAIADGLRRYADRGGSSFQYPPSRGLEALRTEIARRRGVDRDAVIVTNGAGEANFLAMAHGLDRGAGSEVLLPDPVYPYYPGRASMLGGDPVLVPVGADGSLDPAAVAARASEETALVVVNTPNNPTGAVYDPESLRAVVEVAEAHDALVVSDEVYDHFVYSGRFESALGLESDRVLVTNSFSKSMAITGFRVGYLIAPPAHADALATRHLLANVTGSRPAQAAVLAALRRTTPDYYEENRRVLRRRIETFTDALDEAGAVYTRPDGAFYVLARFDGFPGTLENVERLVDEAGVAGMPGEAFGTARGEWIRFALVTDRVDEAARRLAGFVPTVAG